MENLRFKFRAWDKHVKKMGKVTEIIFSNVRETLVKYQYIDDYGKTIDEQSHIDDKGHGVVKLLQFTGLKDKNGKEIYEGDICETVTYSGKPFGTIDVVKFSGGAFKLTDIEDALLPIPLDDSDIQSVEVIGNIFEHPHLIGEKHG